MAFHPISGITSDPGSGVFPSLIYVQGNEQRSIVMNRTPFSVGRKVDKDLVIPDPRVSRDHALIVAENGDFFVVDQGSKHGTYVNGERVQRQRLQRNYRVEFGVRDVAYVIFSPQNATSNTAREFLSQISGIQISTETTDLEKLTLFLEAARKLNTVGVLDEILVKRLHLKANPLDLVEWREMVDASAAGLVVNYESDLAGAEERHRRQETGDRQPGEADRGGPHQGRRRAGRRPVRPGYPLPLGRHEPLRLRLLGAGPVGLQEGRHPARAFAARL